MEDGDGEGACLKMFLSVLLFSETDERFHWASAWMGFSPIMMSSGSEGVIFWKVSFSSFTSSQSHGREERGERREEDYDFQKEERKIFKFPLLIKIVNIHSILDQRVAARQKDRPLWSCIYYHFRHLSKGRAMRRRWQIASLMACHAMLFLRAWLHRLPLKKRPCLLRPVSCVVSCEAAAVSRQVRPGRLIILL